MVTSKISAGMTNRSRFGPVTVKPVRSSSYDGSIMERVATSASLELAINKNLARELGVFGPDLGPKRGVTRSRLNLKAIRGAAAAGGWKATTVAVSQVPTDHPPRRAIDTANQHLERRF